MKRIDQRPDEPRLTFQFSTFDGRRVWLNVTRFEKAYIKAQADKKRNRYNQTPLPEFRQYAEQFDREVVALYQTDAPFAAEVIQ